MLVVDSGVWIDFFNDVGHPAADELEALLDAGEVRIVLPDLVYFEVLRGFRRESDLRQARQMLETLDIEPTCDRELALTAAQHYRSLRQHGITVRSPVDVLVASFCIERDYALLHRDRDFRAFEHRRGLRAWGH